jgi:predicted O-methyltransferase YrrM
MSITVTAVTEPLAHYVRSVTLREPDVLRRLREETASHPRAQMQIAPEQGQFMGLLIRLMGAKKTLEVGVFTGYSSLSVALALPPEGRVVACDVSEEYTSVARRYWKQAGVERKIELRIAPALQSLDALIGEGQAGTFDFAFLDADKENYWNYYERSLVLLRPGGLAAVDNVLWHERVINPDDNEPDTRAIREFNRRLHGDDRVWISMATLGDGLTLAMKK